MLKVFHNFGQKIKCPLCKTEEDDQKHFIECLILKISCPEILNNTEIKYTDLYSNDIEKQNSLSKLLEIAIRKRSEILNT